jgi:glycerol-3-phosphate dehydrogenase (NAD(P)+)
MKITVLGAGAWGTALAIYLAERHPVALWTREPVHAAELGSTRRNVRYLPGFVLPESITPGADLAAALAGAELALAVVPTAGLRALLRRVAALAPGLPVVWGSKGFEAGSAALPHAIAAEELAPGARRAVLSGPSFAEEVARGLPAALTLASSDAAFARATALALHGERLRVYSSPDVVGVEVAGAVKNVMAIASGICDGMKLGLNARAALITRGLAEMTRLGVALGGRAETFIGLAGAGDLILTCTGDLSRNRRVGLALALGRPLAAILEQLGHVAEGVLTAPAVARLAHEQGVEMPITEAVCAILDGRSTPAVALRALMGRDPKSELPALD